MKSRADYILFGFLCLLALLISFLFGKLGMAAGAFVLGLMLVLVVLFTVFSDFRLGYLMLLTYSFFLFLIGRLLPFQFPLGIFVEVFYLLVFLSIFLHNYKSDNPIKENVFKNPMGYSMLIYVVFGFLELLNPNSTSISGRVVGVRETLTVLLSFYVAMNVFKSLNFARKFTKIWLFLALLAALYGMYQEYFGLPAFEVRWASAYEGALKPIWGKIRKWSFLSDVSAFGLFMSYSATVCFILAMGRFEWKKRIILAASGVIMSISMTYSGTRTAFATLLLGIGFYTLLSLNNRKALIFASVFVLIFLGLMYGPFYGATINRMRSTFSPSEDASMMVRDMNRTRVQPYAREHPFGGGLSTAGYVGLKYEPNHPLAGSYDTDSGYLKMALERGWIGLLINLGLYGTALIYGVHNYYKAMNMEIKALYAAYLSSFFALSVAHFTQDSMDQKPVVIIIMAFYAFVIRLIEFDDTNKTIG